MAGGTEVQRGVGTMTAGAIICALVMSFFFVPPVAAQPLCGPASVKYIVRSQNGTTLTTAELQTVRAQLPEEIGGAEVVVDPSIPSLWFWSYRTCVMDLQDVVLEQGGMRMQLSFNLELIPGRQPHDVTIDGLPFQEGKFILDRSGWTRNDQTLPDSSWKSVAELQRLRTAISAPPRDCAATVETGNADLFALRYRAQSDDARSECRKQLVDLILGPTQPVKAEEAARGIEALSYRRLIDDKTLLAPLIECVGQHLDQLGTFCNRALEALTRHHYGDTDFFARKPELTREFQDHAVADWTALVRLLETGRPIFDRNLEEVTVRAVREICAGLQAAISETLPDHPVLAYLQRIGNDEASLGLNTSETVFLFAAGYSGNSRFFTPPGEWPNGGPLSWIRFVIVRSGLVQPSSPPTVDFVIPANEANYREQFGNLDLELRFQIMTDNGKLRAASVEAVRNGLASLRAANQP